MRVRTAGSPTRYKDDFMGNRISLLRLLTCFAVVATACTDASAPRPVPDASFAKTAVADNEAVPNSYVVRFAKLR